MNESEFEANAADARRYYLDRQIAAYEEANRDVQAAHEQVRQSIARLDRIRRRMQRWTVILFVSAMIQIGLSVARLAGWL